MVCRRCGAIVPADWPVCMDCGASTVGGPPPGSEHASDEAFPLLAAANLARRRGQLAEAEKRCREAVERYPQSAAAHSILGEILEDLNRPEEAIACYQIALQLQPNNPRDLERLEHLRQRLQAQGQGQKSGNRPVHVSWMSAASEAPNRGWVVAGVLGLVCLGLLGALLTSKFGGSAAPAAAPRLASGQTSQEVQVLSAMRQAVPTTGTPILVDDVRLDPRGSMAYAVVTVSPVNGVGAQGERGVISQAAVEAMQAAAASNVGWVTVRVESGDPDAGGTLLFIGDGAPSSFRDVNLAALLGGDASGRFQHSWWSPAIRPAG